MAGRWRAGFKWAGTLVGSLVAGVLLTVQPFEAPRPWTDEPVRESVQRSLETQRRGSHISHGRLSAGWARRRLTPTLGAAVDDGTAGRFRTLPLAGFGARRGMPATGVRQDLWTKALALKVADQQVVFIASDLLIVPREVADGVISNLTSRPGLRRDQIYLTATHTHGSLGGWGQGFVAEQFGGGYVPEVRTWLVTQLTEVAREALDSMAPAEIGFDAFAAPEGIRNRLVGEAGAVDPEFAYLRVRREDGREALWGSYGAHATVMGSGEMQFHGDYPGVWQEVIEAETGGLALFAAGAVGSHGPRAPQSGWEGARALGTSLARRVLERRSQCVLQAEVALGSASVGFELPPLKARLGERLQLRPWAAARVLPVADRTSLQGLRIGSWVWLSTPCDFSGELALELKARARASGTKCAVTSFNGDYVGYVIPTRYQTMDSYESRTMCFYGPALTDGFMETLGGLLEVLQADGLGRR